MGLYSHMDTAKTTHHYTILSFYSAEEELQNGTKENE